MHLFNISYILKPYTMKKKYALVLSGGGFKGAFQMGALNHLKANWEKINPGQPMKFDIIAGVSVGALNGAMMAMDEQEALNELWQDIAENGVEEVYTSDFIDTQSSSEEVKFKLNLKNLREKFIPNFKLKINLWKGLGLMLSKRKRKRFIEDLVTETEKEFTSNFKHFRAIADNTPLRKKLAALLDKDKVKSKFLSGFVSLDDGAYHAVSAADYTTNEDFINGVLASSAMPVIWEPVEKISFKGQEVKHLVDGGIKNISPLGDVIKAIKNDTDADYTVIVINCSSGKDTFADHHNSNIGKIALRSLNDIALTEIFNNDIDMFMKINRIVEQVERKSPAMRISSTDDPYDLGLKSFKSIIIQPDAGALGDTLVGTKQIINKRVDHGIEKASEALQLFELHNDATLPTVTQPTLV